MDRRGFSLFSVVVGLAVLAVVNVLLLRFTASFQRMLQAQADQQDILEIEGRIATRMDCYATRSQDSSLEGLCAAPLSVFGRGLDKSATYVDVFPEGRFGVWKVEATCEHDTNGGLVGFGGRARKMNGSEPVKDPASGHPVEHRFFVGYRALCQELFRAPDPWGRATRDVYLNEVYEPCSNRLPRTWLSSKPLLTLRPKRFSEERRSGPCTIESPDDCNCSTLNGVNSAACFGVKNLRMPTCSGGSCNATGTGKYTCEDVERTTFVGRL